MIRCSERHKLTEVDQAKLRDLLEVSFGQRLVAGYFVHKRITRVYLAGDYRGVAILTDEGDAVPYLDKFAVHPETRGNGVARELWARLRAETPALYWRSRPSNPITSWYKQQADGYCQAGAWVVFWYGLAPAKVRACVQRALAIPASLSDPP